MMICLSILNNVIYVIVFVCVRLCCLHDRIVYIITFSRPVNCNYNYWMFRKK